MTNKTDDNEFHVYDSRPDTMRHIEQVQTFMRTVTRNLAERLLRHDVSKMEQPELSVFNEYTPKLKGSTYGSAEYKGFLEGMKEGLEHHYKNNDHHPEHFANGIHDMSLMQITEMLCDWKAATMRHSDGDIMKSIELNQKRFGYSDELKVILTNTVKSMGWESN